MPWTIVLHGTTSGGGHNSGYPTTDVVGPIFSRKSDAETEVMYLNDLRFPKPVAEGTDGSYSVREVAVLTHQEALLRIDARDRKAREQREEQARRLEAQAAALRATGS